MRTVIHMDTLPYYASYGYYPVVYRRPYVYSRPVVVYRNGRRVYRHRPR